MADNLPVNFPIPSENAVASYNWVDVVTSQGYITLYGAKTQSGYVLSSEVLYSDAVYTKKAFTDATFVLQLDLDYDVTIGKPLTLMGKMLVSVPVQVYSSGNVGGYIIAKLRKWNGTTETEIANGTSTEEWLIWADASNNNYYTSDAGTTTRTRVLLVELTVPLTSYKVGETLRVTIESYGKRSGSGTGTSIQQYHDPVGRTFESYTTREGGVATNSLETGTMVVHLPVRLEL